MQKTLLFPICKINIGLYVVEKRPDGYHNLQTLFYPVGLTDSLEICEPRDRHVPYALYVSGVKNLCAPEDNIVVKTYLALKEEFDLPPVEIFLGKRIPTGAGLGGGSSDAAAVLLALRTLYAPRMTDMRLERLAEKLGSDVPFFIRGGTQLAIGRGEIVTPLPPLTAGWFVVVKPEESYSTAEMYRRLDACGGMTAEDSRMEDAVAGNNVHAIAAELRNSFERAVPEDSRLWDIKAALRAQGALGTLLSGSGSAVFGVFDDRKEAAAAAMTLRRTWPQVFVTQPV